MKKIEHLYEPEEILNGIIENMTEFSLDKLYTEEIDYKEAIVLLTPIQTISSAVYISHPSVALNIMRIIISHFQMPKNLRDFHEKLMEYYKTYHIVLIYIKNNRELCILLPKISEKQSIRLKNMLATMANKEYGKTLKVSIGELNYVSLSDSRIFQCIEESVVPDVNVMRSDEIFINVGNIVIQGNEKEGERNDIRI